jgi:hypothetical protein
MLGALLGTHSALTGHHNNQKPRLAPVMSHTFLSVMDVHFGKGAAVGVISCLSRHDPLRCQRARGRNEVIGK